MGIVMSMESIKNIAMKLLGVSLFLSVLINRLDTTSAESAIMVLGLAMAVWQWGLYGKE